MKTFLALVYGEIGFEVLLGFLEEMTHEFRHKKLWENVLLEIYDFILNSLVNFAEEEKQNNIVKRNCSPKWLPEIYVIQFRILKVLS